MDWMIYPPPQCSHNENELETSILAFDSHFGRARLLEKELFFQFKPTILS